MAARRYGGTVPPIFGWHQRSADDTGRRRDSLTQRRAAPTSRSFRLLAAGAVLQRRPLTREASGKSEHGDLPGKYGRYLRGHRIRGAHAGSAKDSRFFPEGVSETVR